jgi:hypothetical protein
MRIYADFFGQNRSHPQSARYICEYEEELQARGLPFPLWFDDCFRHRNHCGRVNFTISIFIRPMPKKRKLSKPRRHSAPDEVSRKALRDGIRELREKHFAPWKPSLTEEAVFQIAEGLEQVAKGLKGVAASGTLPAK